MSGVYIKGLNIDEMNFCPFQDTECGYCLISKDEEGLLKRCERIDKCPYEIVPDHGRLIDSDTLTDYARHTIIRPSDEFASVVINLFDLIESLAINAPTVIEADRSEE